MRHTRSNQRAVTLSTSQRRAAFLTVRVSRLTALPAHLNSSPHAGNVRRGLTAHASCFSFIPMMKTPLPSLQCSRATLKSRSLAPDDPFGEKSSWEDPSEGLYSAWTAIDQDGFLNATQSAEVRNAHFGPEWARFTTVGRMSVKKMKEDQQATPPPTLSAEDATGAATTATAAAPPKRYPSAEELHEAELKAKRRLLERNYMSYEAFVEHELGAGEGFSEVKDLSMGAAGGELYSAASMESAFSAVEGVEGRDRMTQRNTEREALDTVQAAEAGETVPLPNFMFEEYTRRDHCAGGTVEESQAASTPTLRNENHTTGDEESNETEDALTVVSTSPHAAQTGAVPILISRPSASTTGIPTSVVHQVLRALGAPHGDARIPLTDPMHWDTEDIIYYLTVMEQRPADADADAPRDSWRSMDETMRDTFRMASVTGDTLLNVVVPPRLFRLMRRWHARRQDVVNNAWKQYKEAFLGAIKRDDASEMIPAEMVEAVVAQNRAKLDEAVQPLDRILIQETILLCFSYGH